MITKVEIDAIAEERQDALRSFNERAAAERGLLMGRTELASCVRSLVSGARFTVSPGPDGTGLSVNGGVPLTQEEAERVRAVLIEILSARLK